MYGGRAEFPLTMANDNISWISLILFVTVLPLTTTVRPANGLTLTNITVPIVADIREVMRLDCRFDMGAEDLYAVKWYKDEQEFFRYMPHREPDTMSFPVAGVHLVNHGTNCNQSRCSLRIKGLTRDHSGGSYRCEVSSEAPTFRLVSATRNVTVAALPLEEPRIEGLDKSYLEGEIVSVNCISPPSDPAPILSWYINDKQAPSKLVGEMTSSESERDLIARTLTLRFQAERKYAQGNNISLRCDSSLPGIPYPPQSVTATVPYESLQQYYKHQNGKQLGEQQQPLQRYENQNLYWQGMVTSSTSGSSMNHVSVAVFLIYLTIRWRISAIWSV